MSRIMPVVVTMRGLVLLFCDCCEDESLQPAVTASQSSRIVGITIEISGKAVLACFKVGNSLLEGWRRVISDFTDVQI